MNARSGLSSVSLAARLTLLGFLLLTVSQVSRAQGLVSWWPGNGNYNDVVSGNDGTPFRGVLFRPAVYGEGFFFNGTTARIFVADSPSLAITGSLTISAWVHLNAYPTNPIGGAQILFRGDDRSGLDPYSLTVLGRPGTLHANSLQFHISDDSNDSIALYAPIPIGKFVFVAATLDDASSVMSLYENGVLVDWTVTPIRPFADLDPNANPGLGIGNVQSANYDEYFDGIIDDLKIYNTAAPQITPITLQLSQSSVKGGHAVNAKLTVNDSPIVPTSALVSSTVAATVPAIVTVAPGHYLVGFEIKTKTVKTSQTGNISVTLNGVTLTASLTVTP